MRVRTTNTRFSMGNQTVNRGSATPLSDGSYVTQIGTTMSKWADGFAGASYAAGAASVAALTDESGKWDLVRNTGMTITLNNGQLTVGMGTGNGNELLMVGRTDVTIPQNLIVTSTVSQRIVGNEIRFGLVEVDPDTNLPVDHATIAGFFRNMAAFRLSGTASSNATAEAIEKNLDPVRNIAVSINASNSMNDYSVEARPEDITYTTQTADSGSLRNANGGRLSSVVPSPNRVYRPFIWLRNVSAPASNTNVTLHRVVSMDVQELQAEVGGGRGNNLGSQAIPVAVNGTVTTATTVANVTAANTANGASNHKLISAATTNATLVKGSTGKIIGGSIANTSASWRYVKLYNKATAPIPGTDTPVLTLAVQPGGRLDLGQVCDQYGISFATGIGYALTGAAADADTTAIAAGDLVVALLFA